MPPTAKLKPRPRKPSDRPQVSFEIDPETRAALDRLVEHEAARGRTTTAKLQSPVIRRVICEAAAALDSPG